VEKAKKEVAVATLNSKIYFGLVERLKRKNIGFISKKPWEPIPLGVKIVFTTKDEASNIKHHTIVFCEEGNLDRVVEEASAIIQGLDGKSFDELLVGIDPGKTIGLAVVSRGVVLNSSTKHSLKDVFQTLEQTIQSLKPKRVLVKVGTGGCLNQEFKEKVEDFAGFVWEKFKVPLKVLFVDEKNTTTIVKRRKIKKREKDMFSAVEIALRG